MSFYRARLQRTASVQAVAAAVTVTVKATPAKGYTTTSFYVEVQWTPGYPGPFSCSVEFGDGQSTGGQVPTSPFTCSHTYASPGTYAIKATVRDLSSGGVGSGSGSVQVASAFQVTFSANPTSGPAPLTTTFTVTIGGGYPPYSYSLDFGDGTAKATGTGSATVVHTYASVGSYTATLVAEDALSTTVMGQAIGSGLLPLLPRLREAFPSVFAQVDDFRAFRAQIVDGPKARGRGAAVAEKGGWPWNGRDMSVEA